jgi:hypothetical protein
MSTPAAPLINLGRCYEQHDQAASSEYKNLFDPFRFWRGVTDSTVAPPTYFERHFADETRSFTALTVDTSVSVSITFLANPADTLLPTPCALPGDPPNTFRFANRPVRMNIRRGGVDSLIVGTWDLYVAPIDTLNNLPEWRIIRWIETRPAPSVTSSAVRARTSPVPALEKRDAAFILSDRKGGSRSGRPLIS